jgi:hypothetical protein
MRSSQPPLPAEEQVEAEEQDEQEGMVFPYGCGRQP